MDFPTMRRFRRGEGVDCRRWGARVAVRAGPGCERTWRKSSKSPIRLVFSTQKAVGIDRVRSRIGAQRAGTCPGEGNSMRTDATADPRPEYRVAVFGLATRLQHLL